MNTVSNKRYSLFIALILCSPLHASTGAFVPSEDHAHKFPFPSLVVAAADAALCAHSPTELKAKTPLTLHELFDQLTAVQQQKIQKTLNDNPEFNDGRFERPLMWHRIKRFYKEVDISNIIYDRDNKKGHKTSLLEQALIFCHRPPELKQAIIRWGAKTDQETFVKIAKDSSPQCQEGLQMLIEYGAKVNEQNLEGCTALHNAVYGCHATGVRMLLAAGAESNDVINRLAKSLAAQPPYHCQRANAKEINALLNPAILND